ncbi:MAG: ATP-binding protein [Deltaproteobacteria bacterium]|nr:ATP-binding protein [Deltaproteobacteria bacterium]
MKRTLYDRLLLWKDDEKRKPLVLHGARQVGKTWLLKHFGENEFSGVHHIDFDRYKKELTLLFDETIDPYKLIENLSLMFFRPIDIERDLLIFDEIQHVPRALTSLKYFCEQLPQMALCAAGSLLGVSLSHESYPVGKTDEMNLYPLNFEEFLINHDIPLLYQAYLAGYKEQHIAPIAHQQLMEMLKCYYVTGGMPEVVRTYLENRDLNILLNMDKVRKIQLNLISNYMSDFAKHSGKINAIHIASVFENIPMQLASFMDNSVERYKFKDVLPNKKGFNALRGPIDWLSKAGLILKVNICNRAEVPLKSFCKDNLFKLYFFDVGLLGASLEISPSSLMLDNYGMTKGFFVENFVATEFAGAQIPLYSWTHRNSEVEFIIDNNGRLIPVEVKAGQRTKAKSLYQYIIKYRPENAYIFSSKQFADDDTKQIVPLYFAGQLKNMLQSKKI